MVGNYIEGNAIRRFQSEMTSLVSIARNQAEQRGQTVAIQYDESSSQVQVVTTDADGNESVIRNAGLPPNASATDFLVNGESSDSGNWQVPIYSDRTTEGGSISFDFGTGTWSYVISTQGNDGWQRGDEVAAESDKWQAGEREVRGG